MNHGGNLLIDQKQRPCVRVVLLVAFACLGGLYLHSGSAPEGWWQSCPPSSPSGAEPHPLFASATAQCLPPRDPTWLDKLSQSDAKIYSQNGEDGILLSIFHNIGVTNRRYVEFGTQNALECNTRALREIFGFYGLLMDGSFSNPAINLTTEFISPANINTLFEKYSVPDEFDLLSIDVDFDDYFVFQALKSTYRPRVLVMEVNSGIPASESRVVDPTDKRRWTGSCYYGMSLRAAYDLGRRRGYTMVAVDKNAVNAFFIRSDIIKCMGLQPWPFEQLYRSKVHHRQSELESSRKWIFLDPDGNEVKRKHLPDCWMGSTGSLS